MIHSMMNSLDFTSVPFRPYKLVEYKLVVSLPTPLNLHLLPGCKTSYKLYFQTLAQEKHMDNRRGAITDGGSN